MSPTLSMYGARPIPALNAKANHTRWRLPSSRLFKPTPTSAFDYRRLLPTILLNFRLVRVNRTQINVFRNFPPTFHLRFLAGITTVHHRPMFTVVRATAKAEIKLPVSFHSQFRFI
jgi:hypothetical protein